MQANGKLTVYVRAADDGDHIRFHLCPVCGATVFYTTDGLKGYVAVPVGAFADPGFPAPTASVYEERMHSSVAMPEDMEHIP